MQDEAPPDNPGRMRAVLAAHQDADDPPAGLAIVSRARAAARLTSGSASRSHVRRAGTASRAAPPMQKERDRSGDRQAAARAWS